MNPASPAFQWLADFIGIVGLAGLCWRFVVRPHLVKFLQDTVVGPLNKVQHTLTQNGGTNNPPTIPDRFHEVFGRLDSQDELAELREQRFEEWRVEHKAWAEAKGSEQDVRLTAIEGDLSQLKESK